MEITYKEGKYPYRIIELEDDTLKCVSTKALEDEILMGLAQNDERAEDIDDLVYYYLSEDEWDLSDEEVVELIKKNS